MRTVSCRVLLATFLLTLGLTSLRAQEDGPVQLTGILNILHSDDFSRGRCATTYLLVERGPRGRSHILQLRNDLPGGLRQGSRVNVRGHRGNGEIRDAEVMALDENNPGTATGTAAALVVGNRTAIVILCNFQDLALTITPAQVDSVMFSGTPSVSDCYEETSFSLVSFSGAVVGPYTIAYSASAGFNMTNNSNWTAAANNAATAAGVNVNQYQHRVYVFPRITNAPAGMATVGSGSVWVYGYGTTGDVYAHELGHNLGMHHASTTTTEYGDISDFMGYGNVGLRQLNAPHKIQMGWVPPERIVTATSSGAYTLTMLEQPTIASQVLKLPRPGATDALYISYRRKVGLDSILSSTYADRINIHQWGSSGNTVFLSSLSNGTSYQDYVTGIRVTQNSADASAASVTVAFEQIARTPSVVLFPSSQPATAGSSVQYRITVTNNDTTTRPSTTFSFATSLPAGWGSFVPASLTLAPQARAYTTLTVAVPAGTANGNVGFSINLADGVQPAHSLSLAASVSVGPLLPPGYVTAFNDASGWTLDPAMGGVGWAVDGTPGTMPGGAARSPSNSLNYNDGVDYDSGLANRGMATSPPIRTAGLSVPALTFWCNYQTETSGSYIERRSVRISNDGFVTTVLSQLLSTSSGPCAGMQTWHQHTVALDPAWGMIQVQFEFDTIINSANTYAGWFVDDLQVSGNPDTTPPGVPALVSPTHASSTLDTTPSFDWSDITDPSGVTYQIQIDDAADFASPVLSVAGLVTSAHTASTTLAAGSYSWRVRAMDGAGNLSGWSAVWGLTIQVPVDTTPPSCLITSPAGGSIVSSTVSFNASASDNVGVARVEFFVDGALVGTDFTSPYGILWNTSAVLNSTHSLLARAYDAAGNVGTSGTVSVTVNNAPPPDTTAPVCSISAPAAGTTVSGIVTVTATATDNVGVTKVEFYRDGALQGTDTLAPYGLPWDTRTVANGSHSLLVRAYDAAGNSAGSATVSVTVNNVTVDASGPGMAFLSPVNGATVSRKVAVSVSATDPSGVSRVEFYVNGVLKSTDTAAPWGWSWNSRNNRGQTVTLSAKGFDTLGNATTVSVTVQVQ